MSLTSAFLTMTGNVTRDPELRKTPNGHDVVNFGFAHTPRIKGADGEWRDGETLFVAVTAWRDLAVNVSQSVKKGDRVRAEGDFTVRSYTDASGNKRVAYEMVANEVSVPLSRATVEITKNAPRSNNGGGRAAEAAAPGAHNFSDEPPF